MPKFEGTYAFVEFVCQNERKWHFLLGLIGGIAEHDALVTGADILIGAVLVDTLGNVGRLFLEAVDHRACAVVETLFIRIVSDFLKKR